MCESAVLKLKWNWEQALALSFSSMPQQILSTDQQSTDIQRSTCILWIPNLSRSITAGFILIASGYGWSVHFFFIFFPWDHIFKKIVWLLTRCSAFLLITASGKCICHTEWKTFWGGFVLSEIWCQYGGKVSSPLIVFLSKSVILEQVPWVSAGYLSEKYVGQSTYYHSGFTERANN